MNQVQQLEKDCEKVENLMLNIKRRIEEMQLYLHSVETMSIVDINKWLKYIEEPGVLQAKYGINVNKISDISR
jgi:hypothetical protein